MYGVAIRFKGSGFYKIDENEARNVVNQRLSEIGYVRVWDGVWTCPDPKTAEMLVVHDTIEALKKLEWFPEAIDEVYAFELRSWGNLLEAFKR